MRVLAGDIGGTNARLALVEVSAGAPPRLLDAAVFPSPDYPGLAPIVHEFVRRVGGEAVEAAGFGIAGPVVGDELRPSNLSWVVNLRTLGAEIGVDLTVVVNDFAAVGYGIPWLTEADLVTLQAGEAVAGGPVALIGAGTGLGEAYLLWSPAGYEVHSSEGGHVDFAARDELQWGLARFLHEEFGNVSYERVLSGAGLVNVYRYLAASGVAPEQPAVREAMAREEPAAVISRHGLAGTDELCRRALDLFASVYGAQAGNLALTVLATGGVYLAGGIAPRLVEKLRDGTFLDAFRQKGRLTGLLSTVPVHVVMSPDVGLLGAARAAARLTGALSV